MTFPSFPYTSRKIQEGSVTTLSGAGTDYPAPTGSPDGANYPYYPPPDPGHALYASYGAASSAVFSPKSLQSPRQRTKVRSNAGKPWRHGDQHGSVMGTTSICGSTVHCTLTV